jgi:hypothetical protein
MPEPSSPVLYTAVYDDSDLALADLAAFEALHKAEVLGKYDAAVIDKQEGKPRIVKRADHPAIRFIPELFGGGELPRSQLREAAESLEPSQSALIVVGEATLEKGFDRAVTRGIKTVKREMDAATDALAKELTESLKA